MKLRETAMSNVYVVQHVHEFVDGHEDVKFIGVYSSRHNAEAAVQRLLSAPGFSDAPEGFDISEYGLDTDHWTEGYCSWSESLSSMSAVAS
jgi:hypothetical protein